jgi:hypothetical protein
MHSSRKSNVKRHIENLHGGNGGIVSFMDYMVGKKSGLYYTSAPPTYIKRKSSTTIFDTFKQELPKAFFKVVSYKFGEHLGR